MLLAFPPQTQVVAEDGVLRGEGGGGRGGGGADTATAMEEQPPVSRVGVALLAVFLTAACWWYVSYADRQRRAPEQEARSKEALARVRARQQQKQQEEEEALTEEQQSMNLCRAFACELPAPSPSLAAAPPLPACLAQCEPLASVDSLWQWAPPAEYEHDPASLPYRAPPSHVLLEQTRRGRLLVCHDFKGGYHAYETGCYASCSALGGASYGDGAYRVSAWELVDSFVYFSHSLVTVPPPAWINLCHAHEVKALGTLITEWDQGHQHCSRLFADTQAAETTARQLAALARYRRFEGWLINIENKVDWEGGE